MIGALCYQGQLPTLLHDLGAFALFALDYLLELRSDSRVLVDEVVVYFHAGGPRYWKANLVKYAAVARGCQRSLQGRGAATLSLRPIHVFNGDNFILLLQTIGELLLIIDLTRISLWLNLAKVKDRNVRSPGSLA